jgi:hypothetical protein
MGKINKSQFLKLLSERIASQLTKNVLSETKKNLELKLENFDTDDFLWSDAADAARADIEKEQGVDSWSPLGDQESSKHFVNALKGASEKDVNSDASAWKQAYTSFGEQLTAHITQDSELAEFSTTNPEDFMDCMAVAMYKYMMDRHANTPFLSSIQQWIIDFDDQFDPTDEDGQIQLNHIENRIYKLLGTLEKPYNKSIIKKRLTEERKQLISLLKEVWEWSHSPEAYDNARENLHGLSHEELVEIMLEWVAYEAAGGSNSVMDADFDAVDRSKFESLPQDVLADAIFNKAEELSSSDNGGHHLWMCPYGCHKVSADLMQDVSIDEAGDKGVNAPHSDMMHGEHDPNQTYDWRVLFLNRLNAIIDDSKTILNKSYTEAMKQAKGMISTVDGAVDVDVEEFERDIVYHYHINLDERGSFYADVRDENGKTVYEIKEGNELPEGESSIFEDGFMKHKNDLVGLEEYLKQMGIMERDASLVADHNESIMSEDVDDLDMDGGDLSDDPMSHEYVNDPSFERNYYVLPPTAEDPRWYVVDDGDPISDHATEEEANEALAAIKTPPQDEYGTLYKEGSDTKIEDLLNEIEVLMHEYRALIESSK